MRKFKVVINVCEEGSVKTKKLIIVKAITYLSFKKAKEFVESNMCTYDDQLWLILNHEQIGILTVLYHTRDDLIQSISNIEEFFPDEYVDVTSM